MSDESCSGKIRFPFAGDNYVVVLSRSFLASEYSLKVEDLDGDHNGGNFKTVIYPLKEYEFEPWS